MNFSLLKSVVCSPIPRGLLCSKQQSQIEDVFWSTTKELKEYLHQYSHRHQAALWNLGMWKYGINARVVSSAQFVFIMLSDSTARFTAWRKQPFTLFIDQLLLEVLLILTNKLRCKQTWHMDIVFCRYPCQHVSNITNISFNTYFYSN